MIGITVYNIDKHFIATNFHWHWAIYNSTVLHVNFVHRKPMTSVAREFDYSQRKVSTLLHAMKSAAFFFPPHFFTCIGFPLSRTRLASVPIHIKGPFDMVLAALLVKIGSLAPLFVGRGTDNHMFP